MNNIILNYKAKAKQTDKIWIKGLLSYQKGKLCLIDKEYNVFDIDINTLCLNSNIKDDNDEHIFINDIVIAKKNENMIKGIVKFNNGVFFLYITEENLQIDIKKSQHIPLYFFINNKFRLTIEQNILDIDNLVLPLTDKTLIVSKDLPKKTSISSLMPLTGAQIAWIEMFGLDEKEIDWAEINTNNVIDKNFY